MYQKSIIQMELYSRIKLNFHSNENKVCFQKEINCCLLPVLANLVLAHGSENKFN